MLKSILIAGEDEIRIPNRAFAFTGFRRWLHSGRFPHDGLVSFIGDQIEVDTNVEEFYEHGQVKNEVARVISNLFKESKAGLFAPDGTRFTSPRARLSTEPDGLVLLHESIRSGRVRFVSGKSGRNTEVLGTPDLVIEIVSPSSEEKDAERLLAAYFKAKIPEYWLIDVRDGTNRFDIFRRKPTSYVASRKSDGWQKSPVLGRSFRLTATTDVSGNPDYTLEVR